MTTPKTKSNSFLWISLAGVIVAIALLIRLEHRQAEPGRQTEKPSGEPPAPLASSQNPGTHFTSKPAQGLEAAREALSREADVQTNRQTLADLRRELSGMPKNEGAAEIRRFLDSKADAPTHLGFKLAANGTLDEAPTLRTFLLDELARIDPAAAADYAKLVLARPDAPDEWAIALRNLAAGDNSAEGRALLQQKMTEMLQNTAWQQNPSTGYLEAFDVPVYLGGTNFVPTLSNLVRSQDNPAVAHAAFLALDRLVINNPKAMLESLAANPDLMQGRELTRADYFARADARDPQQRQILENYLLNPALNPKELQAFAGIFPNANYMISQNLLTQPVTPNRDSLQSRDAQSLALAQQWVSDPRFAQVAPALQKVIKRLQGFAAQAKGDQ